MISVELVYEQEGAQLDHAGHPIERLELAARQPSQPAQLGPKTRGSTVASSPGAKKAAPVAAAR